MSYRYSKICAAAAAGCGLLTASAVSSASVTKKYDFNRDILMTNRFQPSYSILSKTYKDFVAKLSPRRSLVVQAHCYAIEEEAQKSNQALHQKMLEILKLTEKAKRMTKQNENPNKIEMMYLQALQMAMTIQEHTTVTSIQVRYTPIM